MEQAIIDLINLIKDGLEQPILNALNSTTPFNQIISFINNLLNAVFKLFNNDNAVIPTISNELIAEVLAMVVLIYLISLIVNLFIAIKNTIVEYMRPLTISEQVGFKIKKRNKHQSCFFSFFVFGAFWSVCGAFSLFWYINSMLYVSPLKLAFTFDLVLIDFL